MRGWFEARSPTPVSSARPLGSVAVASAYLLFSASSWATFLTESPAFFLLAYSFSLARKASCEAGARGKRGEPAADGQGHVAANGAEASGSGPQ